MPSKNVPKEKNVFHYCFISEELQAPGVVADPVCAVLEGWQGKVLQRAELCGSGIPRT